MFLSIKKETIVYSLLLLLGVSMLIVIGAIKEAKEDIFPTNQEVVNSVADKIIVIDAGHGGADAGASANGISEKDINLAVAKKLKECIEQNGGKVVMTREEDVSTADESRQSGTSWKKSDLQNRKNMVLDNNADMFVSIHMNKFPQEKYKGAQVFYSADNDESRRLGETIQKSLPEILQDGNERVAKKSDGSIYILKGVSVPSVVVECGFLSNVEEAKNLQNDEYQGKVAFAIYSGIENYLRQ